ncbi:MAG: hypothetical protein E5V40_08985 [Mesorhizobium sp.]|nr:MAG: hypothetical protein E5V40_08985 [Mesorhizobium sp.]
MSKGKRDSSTRRSRKPGALWRGYFQAFDFFLKDVDDFDEFQEGHEQVFAKFRPASDLVVVAKLVKGMSVQIEAQAVI